MVYAIDISQPAVNPIAKFGSFSDILNQVIPLLGIIAAIFFLVMAILAGFTIISGSGEAEKIKKAQSTLTMAIVGLLIVVFASVIVKLVAQIFNIGNLPL